MPRKNEDAASIERRKWPPEKNDGLGEKRTARYDKNEQKKIKIKNYLRIDPSSNFFTRSRNNRNKTFLQLRQLRFRKRRVRSPTLTTVSSRLVRKVF